MSTTYTCSDDKHVDCPCVMGEKGKKAPAVPTTTGPVKLTLEADASKWLCTCGSSKNYPYCDGSHKSVPGDFKPRELKNDTAEAKDFYVCSCGHTKNPAGTCDGSHRKVAAKE